MSYKITEECISCGVCLPECPTQAITVGKTIYEIDPEKCISCGTCAGVCPVGAPIEE